MDASILQSILTLLLVVGTAYFTLARLARVAVLVNTGRRDEVLTDTPSERIGKVVRLVLGHEKVLEDRWAGLMHMTYIYGFLVLSVGHVEVVLEGLSAFLATLGKTPFLYEHFLPAGATAVYHLSQDVMAAVVLVVASAALVRRWSGKVARLMPRSMDAEIILYLIVALYVTFFGLVGSGVLLDMRASGEFGMRAASPVSSVVAWALASLPPAAIPWVRGAAWWAHVLVFLGFACYITISKHMHLIFAVPNIYFFRRQRRGLPPAIDFEEAEKFGIDRVQELPWKSLLDTFACTECGRCNAVCPAHLTAKPLKPMKLLHDIKANLRGHNAEGLLALRDARGRPIPEKAEAEEGWEPKTPLISQAAIDHEIAGSVRFDGAYTQIDGQVHVDELWACTTCGACMEVCPVLIDSVPGSLVGLRQSLVMMESSFPKEVTSAFKGMEVQGNPWGVGQDQRLEWAAGLEVPVMADIAADSPEREVEYLFWVGCAGATDDRAKRVQQALVRVLKAAGVDFAILGREEKCTGDMARRLGNEYLFISMARENIETLGKYKFQKILTTCPHCLNTLKNEYRELGTAFTVVHHTQLLSELLAAGRLPTLETPTRAAVTFHDPCYLGRYNDGYQSPREVLHRIGAEAREMELNQQRAMCCGAGGGRMFIEETLGKRVNVERTEQALATGAETIAVGCPFCMTMLTDGTKAKDAEEKVRVRDLAELVAERLGPEETGGVTSSSPAGEPTGRG